MSKYSVRKPITVLMGILIVMVLGIFSLTKMSLALFPDMNLPYVVVVTPYPGANAETVVEDITSKVESQVTSMSGYSSVQSTSREHYSIVIVEFNEGTNMDGVMIDLRSRLDNMTFPETATKPTIMQVSPDMLPVMTVSMSVEYPDLSDEEEFIKTTEFINHEIMDRLNAIEGVAEVSLTGAAEVVLQVKLNQTEISKYQAFDSASGTYVTLTNAKVIELIKEQDHNELVGIALDNGEIRMLHLGNEIQSLDELKNLPLALKENGTNVVVKLSDLADPGGIKYINDNAESYSKVNGQQTVSLSFQMQNGAVITDVTKNITKTLDAITNEYGNVSYFVVLDQGEYINLAIGSVAQNLILGAILAIGILFIFLRDIKPTLIVGLSIPISVVATFMCMYFAGINLNMLSMGGLALGIGMLVDNAIVVIENIYRLRKEGKSKKEAAVQGARGVASAIIASTLTTIVVFVPVLFIEGLVKDIFASMAYTIAFSLLASLVIALTMVPSIASRILTDPDHCPKCDGSITPEDTECPTCGKKLKKYKAPKQRKDTKFTRAYDKTIRWCLGHKLIVSLSAVLLFGLMLGLTAIKGFVLIPSTDEGMISASVNIDNTVSFETTSKYADKLSQDIRNIEGGEIDTVSISFGTSTGMMALVSSSSNSSYTNVSITVKLKENHRTSTADFAEKVRKTIANFDVDFIDNLDNEDIVSYEVEQDSNSMASLTSSGVNINVKGYDLEKMEIVANRIYEIINNVEGVTKANLGVAKDSDNIKIYVNKEKAAAVGLTQQDFIDSLALVFQTTGLDVLATDNSATVKFNGVEYTIDIPSDMNFEGFTLTTIMKLFGGYEDFLKNFMVFDKEWLKTINDAGVSIYAILPVDLSDPTKGLYLGVNPLIFFDTSLDASGIQRNEIITLEATDLQDPEVMSKIMSGEYTSIVSHAKGSVISDSDDAIAQVQKTTGYSSISTDGKYRYFSVTSRVGEDYNITKVSAKITEEINKYLESDEFAPYRDFVHIEYQGENEEIMTTVREMIIALVVGVLLVYMVIAIQFQSLKYPLIIMATVPLAFTGGLIATLILGFDISVVTLMGLIILVGVVVNNGIVLVDYINQLRESGLTVKEACVVASKTRLRPIMMTALTTIFGLIFMAIGMSNGSELLQPLAVTAIGGLLYATVLTLLVVPVFYCAMNRKTIKKEEAVVQEGEK